MESASQFMFFRRFSRSGDFVCFQFDPGSSVCISRCEVCCSSHGSGRGSCVLLPLRGDHCLWLHIRCPLLISGVLRHVCSSVVIWLQEEHFSSHGSCFCSRVWLLFCGDHGLWLHIRCILHTCGLLDSHFVWDPGVHHLCFCWILLDLCKCSLVTSGKWACFWDFGFSVHALLR